MARISWLVIALGLFCLPGCHLIVRLGEAPPDTEQVEPDERTPLPFIDPQTPPPPQPGLDDETERETPPPPRPGLNINLEGDDSNAPGVSSLERRADGDHFFDNNVNDGNFEENDDDRGRSKRLSPQELFAVRRRINGNTGINTNSAISPGVGQFVYRTQLRFTESHSSPGATKIDVNRLINPHVLAYGVNEKFSLFGNIPLIKRDGTVRPPVPGAFAEKDDFGIADMRFFAKYRFMAIDGPGETTRWAVFGGMEVPSYDKNFSSDSWDPFFGTVWTYQSLEWGLDLDVFWNVNTGRGINRHDLMRYDAAYTYVLLTGQTLDEKFWQLNSIFEMNGSYLFDGSHLVYVAPGFQLSVERMIIEASLQLPVVRDLKRSAASDFVFIIGSRITW